MVTTIVRGLVLDEIHLRDAVRVLMRESSTGLRLSALLVSLASSPPCCGAELAMISHSRVHLHSPGVGIL